MTFGCSVSESACAVSERDGESRSFAHSLFFHGVSLVLGGDGFGLEISKTTYGLFVANLGCDIGTRGRMF